MTTSMIFQATQDLASKSKSLFTLPLMRTVQSNARPTDLVIATMLAMVMVLAQWVGLHHSVRHAGLQQSLISAAPSSAQIDVDYGDAHHSCIAFDAAALADSISLAPYLAPLLTSTHVLALWSAFASWDAPFALYFSSRAPPLL